jgi:uncharacterized protein (DUF2235 family)
MSRNLVVCLDGTDNQFGKHNTNVVRLYQSLDRDPSRQLGYYDPGVGTIWERGTLSKVSRKMQMVLGLAFGLGVTSNVAEAYSFLMQHYQTGDRILIFGFSRGALEARALAGLIYRCGLLEPHLQSLEPYAMQMYQTPGNNTVLAEFQRTFSRTVDVEFLGLWDTVTSMGNVWAPIYWPHTKQNPCVRRVAHAIAIDERRAFFRQNRWDTLANQDVSEVWFAGVHSDVGGGYDAASGRLWAITLRWLMGHARLAGLLVENDRWQGVLAQGNAGPAAGSDAVTDQHDSLTGGWKLLELVPKSHRRRRPDNTYDPPRVMIPALEAGLSGRPRELSPGEHVHRTVLERFVGRADYRPDTLVKAGLTLHVAQAFLATSDELWTVPALRPTA